MIQLTVADLDYLGLGTAAVFEIGGPVREALSVRRPGRGIQQTDLVDGSVSFASRALEMEFDDVDGQTRLRARFESSGTPVEVDVLVAAADDSLNVVVPWTDRRFQFTSKQIGRPARGTLRIGAKEQVVDGHAGFDFGRGRWPTRTRWNWGAAAGQAADGFLALQLGSQWTDGTGQNENGVFLDGVLHKLDCHVTFERSDIWRIYSTDSDEVDLRLIPTRERPIRGGPIGRLDLSFGHWEGRVRAHDRDIEVKSLFGWAEEMRVWW